MRKRKSKKYFREIAIEDVFLDKLAKSDENRTEVSERKLEVPLRKANFVFLLLLGIIVFGVFIAFTFRLQVYGREKYTALADQNKYIGYNITSERGVIYDRNMNQLVRNEASFDLWLIKVKFYEQQFSLMPLKLEIVAKILEQDLDSLYEKIKIGGSEILLAKNLNHKALILLETRGNELGGFGVRKQIVRHYEGVESLGHILGYLGKINAEETEEFMELGYDFGDSIGKEGVEKIYEKELKEQKGRVQIERTAQGEILSQKVMEYPKSGKALVLSLDLDLQKKVEQVLSQTLKDVESEKGAVIILNPNNGEVLASVSLPGFDNNLFSGGISFEDFEKLNQNENNPQLNRVISGYYPPGSTIKPTIAMAGLSEDIISENTSLYAPLDLCIVNIYTEDGQCFSDWAFHGWTDVRRAIAESVNPFFYIIGGGYTRPLSSSEFFDERLVDNFKGLGVRLINKYLDLFGYGKKTGIDLPGEVGGRVPTPEWKESYYSTAETKRWYLGDTYNLSIGQGNMLATPLQMAVGTAAIANQGTLVSPKIVKQIINPQTKETEQVSGGVSQITDIDPYIYTIVRQGMRQTVASGGGSAHRLDSLPVEVAAKTGTAQIYPSKEIYHNWIAVFAPYENPEIVIVVLIEEVEGLRVAAQTTAKEILQYYFENN